MKFACLLGSVRFDSQKRFIHGISERAREHGDDIYFFFGDAERYSDRTQYEIGEFAIYSLPELSMFDAIMYYPDTIHDEQTVSRIYRAIEASGKPCVTVGVKESDGPGIYLENRTGMQQLMEHLFHVHHVNSVIYLAGPKDNISSLERLQVIREFTAAHDIAFTPQDVYYGAFTYESGYEALSAHIRSRRPLPDAIIAANDDMAIGAADLLKSLGYSIPEDVILTGYDDTVHARTHVPAITTVSRGERRCGNETYELAREYALTGRAPVRRITYSHLAVGASCGCRTNHEIMDSETRTSLVSNTVTVDKNLSLLKNMTAEFSSISSYGEFIRLAGKVPQQLGLKECYICLSGRPEEYEQLIVNEETEDLYEISLTDYKPFSHAVVCYKKGRYLPPEVFPTKQLLPGCATSHSGGNIYYFMPLHHMERCFGYLVIANHNNISESSILPLYTLQLSCAFERILRLESMRTIMKRLDRLRFNDALTGALNRAGMEEFWPRLQQTAAQRQLDLCVLFVDINDLKTVNDHFGHEEGDRYINAVAAVMKQCRHEHELLVRFGGDEFVLLGLCAPGDDSRPEQLRRALQQYNLENPCPYRRGIGIGFAATAAASPLSPDVLIRKADQSMYLDKRETKVQGAEG